MATIAMAYQGLSDIDAVAPLDDADRACLADMREVLKRHGRLDRFGVMLLHSHFPIHEGEVLLERCDPDLRQLTLEVAPQSVLASDQIVPTSWRLSDESVLLGCYQACVKEHLGEHRRKHVQR